MSKEKRQLVRELVKKYDVDLAAAESIVEHGLTELGVSPEVVGALATVGSLFVSIAALILSFIALGR